MDSHEEFLAASGADGRVLVFGLYSTEHDDQFKLEAPAFAVALAPDFYRLGQFKQLITADSRLIHVLLKKGSKPHFSFLHCILPNLFFYNFSGNLRQMLKRKF